MSTIRIGILGAARIAPRGIIEPAQRRTDTEIVCVAARDPARARAFASEYAIPHVAESYAALIRRDDIDLIYNALPSTGHAEWSIAALDAGKSVLCEKPFALNVEEARAMIAASARAGKPLVEAFHYRFHAALRRFFEIVSSGALGVIEEAEAHFCATIPYAPDELRWRPDQNGGALMDLGCYTVHSLRTTLRAEPEVISAEAEYQHGVDVWTRAALQFGNVPARLSCSMREPYAAPLIVRGAQGLLKLDNFVVPQRGHRLTLEQDGAVKDLTFEAEGSYDTQLAHMVQVLAGAASLTGGADAIANLTALDAIRRRALVKESN